MKAQSRPKLSMHAAKPEASTGDHGPGSRTQAVIGRYAATSDAFRRRGLASIKLGIEGSSSLISQSSVSGSDKELRSPCVVTILPLEQCPCRSLTTISSSSIFHALIFAPPLSYTYLGLRSTLCTRLQLLPRLIRYLSDSIYPYGRTLSHQQ